MIKNKKGIIISLVMLAISGCIGFKVLGDDAEDVDFEKVELLEGYVPEQQIVEENNRFEKQQQESLKLYDWVQQDIECKKLGVRHPQLTNYLNTNVYVGNKEEKQRNINKYYNTVNCIQYLRTELYKKENIELKEELFSLVENYIYSSRMGNIEDIKLSMTSEVEAAVNNLNDFISDNKIKIKDIMFLDDYYDYTVGSLPLDFKVSYALTVKDGKELLGTTIDQVVYLDLDEETLYSDWKTNKKNNNYKFKVIGLENFNAEEYLPEEE